MAEFTSTVPENVHEVLGVNIASVGLIPSLFPHHGHLLFSSWFHVQSQ